MRTHVHLTTQDLTKGYESGPVVDGISLKVSAGQRLGKDLRETLLLGPCVDHLDPVDDPVAARRDSGAFEGHRPETVAEDSPGRQQNFWTRGCVRRRGKFGIYGGGEQHPQGTARCAGHG